MLSAQDRHWPGLGGEREGGEPGRAGGLRLGWRSTASTAWEACTASAATTSGSSQSKILQQSLSKHKEPAWSLLRPPPRTSSHKRHRSKEMSLTPQTARGGLWIWGCGHERMRQTQSIEGRAKANGCSKVQGWKAGESGWVFAFLHCKSLTAVLGTLEWDKTPAIQKLQWWELDPVYPAVPASPLDGPLTLSFFITSSSCSLSAQLELLQPTQEHTRQWRGDGAAVWQPLALGKEQRELPVHAPPKPPPSPSVETGWEHFAPSQGCRKNLDPWSTQLVHL